MNIRNVFIDNLRGINLISMILFHAIWDLVYIFGMNIEWYNSWVGDVWQICIASTFVILAGYCYCYSHNKIKHGLKVFIAGGIVSLVTYVFMPENIIIFGVLTMLGSCMIIMIPIEKVLMKVNAKVGFFINLILFVLTYSTKDGYIGIENIASIKLPKVLYCNLLTTYIGFPKDGFFSTDYFGIVPWFFLFIVGYFLKRIIASIKFVKQLQKICEELQDKGIRVVGGGIINWLGRHSLIVYMLHQPLVYGILFIVFEVLI